MKHQFLIAALVLPTCACSTTGGNEATDRAVYSSALGAALGGMVGMVAGGSFKGAGTGALAGAAAGAALGAATAKRESYDGVVVKGVEYYRDTRGFCYYIDVKGQAVYDTAVRC